MITKELLACVTPSAIKYIEKAVDSKNKADYKKLKKLFDEQCFEAKSFDDTSLNPSTFDWCGLARDRNWWWQLQALPFLNWYSNSWALQSEEERNRYFSMCLDAIHNWVRQAKENKDSPLAWHDHATAFRVRNLTNWLLFCRAEELPVGEESRAEMLGRLIKEHLDWLQEDKHYSRHTNHGFDQAMIALTIGLMFDHADFEAYRLRNRERLKEEITFAFTNEGVHKENSPGYQKFMLSRLKQLRYLSQLGEQEASQIGERYIEKADAFLRAITLPNGYLPMIGDTRGKDEGLPYEQKDNVDVLDYSSSGYVVIRGVDGAGKEFFILLKNVHDSNYHRHDDDMMIYLFYDGEVVLGDGGLYSHQETDQKRMYLRSYRAHSVPYLDANAIRDNKNLSKSPAIKINEKSDIGMWSKMFGEELHREIKISYTSHLEISVHDRTTSDSTTNIYSNFFFERKIPFFIGKKLIQCFFKNFIFEMHYSGKTSAELNYGWNDVSGGALISKEYGKSESAASLSIVNSAITLKFSCMEVR